MNDKILASSMLEGTVHKPNRQLHLGCAQKTSCSHPKYEEAHSFFHAGIKIYNPFKDLVHYWGDKVFEQNICLNDWHQYRKSSKYEIGGKT